MSLLLEALKKAEKAKEEAQKRATATTANAPLRLEPELDRVNEPAAAKRVTTRSELPDIREPVEIASADLSDRAPEATAATGAKPTPQAPAAASPREDARPPEEAVAAKRQAARKTFEAKFKEPNPRLPFYITLGVLGALGVGIVIYFWWQLRPPAQLVNLNPPRQSAQAIAAAAPAASAPVQPAGSVAAPQIPGLPSAPAKPAAAREAETRAPIQAASATAPTSARPVAPPAAPSREASSAAATVPARPAASAEPREARAVTFSRPQPRVHPQVEAGYAAYVSGDFARAKEHYEQAVREEPGNRDALLGLAAVEARGGRAAAAEALYLRLLQADPRDAHAQAALLGLRGGRIDPVAAESRVKSLLAAEPGAAVLHFALGNQLALQGRWPEAQQEYFKAFAAEPGNADFAYNLAVSLDQLRQPRLALDYYRRALELAGKAGASFDSDAARERVAQLSR
jgi:tetratricopeptide (TPR) repeat protein